MLYKRKTPSIEAFQYDGDFKDSDGNYYVPNWATEALDMGVLFYKDLHLVDPTNPDRPLDIPAQLFLRVWNGEQLVNVGDYLVYKHHSVSCVDKYAFESEYEPYE